MRTDKDIFISFSISCAAHALLLLYAAYTVVGGLAPAPHKEEKAFHVKMAPDNLPLRRMLISRAGSEGPVKAVPGYGGPLFDAVVPGFEGAPGVIPREEEDSGQIYRKKMGAALDLPDKRVIERPKQNIGARAVRVDITNPGKDAIPIPSEPEFAASLDDGYLPEEFIKEMPGFTPSSAETGPGILGYKPFHGSRTGTASGGGSGSPRHNIDEYLVADLAVYKDPADGQKYFKIAIMAGKDAYKFKVLPKEITFLIDCSLSINPGRMEEFKRGFFYCLDHLGKDDTFNVISFADSPQALSRVPLVNTPLTVTRAKRFIAKLLPESSTNVYLAFADIVDSPPKHRPSYIILVSDGRSTTGIMDSRDIIVSINRSNKGMRPIFSFSGGARTNRYLLDFIAYCNRGWAEHAERTAYIARGLSTLYTKIKDPILLNLRYHFSGISTDEIYPKTLPDFYRGSAFTVFGRYDSENEFSLQLLGDTGNETLAPIFSDTFATARQGTEEIARQWAFNKVYYLIGKLAEKKNDPELIRQIKELCAKFGIKTPYSEGIQ